MLITLIPDLGVGKNSVPYNKGSIVLKVQLQGTRGRNIVLRRCLLDTMRSRIRDQRGVPQFYSVDYAANRVFVWPAPNHPYTLMIDICEKGERAPNGVEYKEEIPIEQDSPEERAAELERPVHHINGA